MGTLTIRTTEEQDQLIEQVQKLLGESAVSKTLLHCVTEYQKLTSSLEERNKKLDETLLRVNELENTIHNYLQSQQALTLAVAQPISPRTGKSASPPTTREQAQKHLLGIKEIFRVNS